MKEVLIIRRYEIRVRKSVVLDGKVERFDGFCLCVFKKGL